MNGEGTTGAGREALRAALERFEVQLGALPAGSDTAEVTDGLYAVADLLDREPQLRRAFTDPASSPQSRQGLADALLGAQLGAVPLQVVRDLVAGSWGSGTELRNAIELLASTSALAGAERNGQLDDVEDELFRFSRLVEREPQLRAALTNPALPDDRKVALLRSLLGTKAHAVTLRLVEVAVTRPRGRSLETSLDELQRLAAQRRQRLVAEVRVAVPLDAAQQERLERSLARIYGRQVQLQVDLDPSVIGGVQVRIGDEVLDGTVARKLDAAERRLAG